MRQVERRCGMSSSRSSRIGSSFIVFVAPRARSPPSVTTRYVCNAFLAGPSSTAPVVTSKHDPCQGQMTYRLDRACPRSAALRYGYTHPASHKTPPRHCRRPRPPRPPMIRLIWPGLKSATRNSFGCAAGRLTGTSEQARERYIGFIADVHWYPHGHPTVLHRHRVGGQGRCPIQQELARGQIVLIAVPRAGQRTVNQLAGADRPAAVQTTVLQRNPPPIPMKHADGQVLGLDDLAPPVGDARPPNRPTRHDTRSSAPMPSAFSYVSTASSRTGSSVDLLARLKGLWLAALPVGTRRATRAEP